MPSADGAMPEQSLGPGQWTGLIDEIVADKWYNPETNSVMSVDYDRVVFERSLDGAEADLVQSMELGSSFAIVCDAATHDALGGRVAKSISKLGSVDAIVLDHPHADLSTVEELKDKIKAYEGCLLYTSPSPRDLSTSRMPSSA